MKKRLTNLCAALALAFASGTSSAGGIPVIDVASLAQAIAQVEQMIQQLTELKRHYDKLHQSYEAISGARNLGDILNNRLLQDYIPANARQVIQGLERGGYDGLTAAAKGLRDAAMIYNCGDVHDPQQRARCESDLARPYQYKAYFDEALARAGERSKQIQSLMTRAGQTRDAKEIAEVQARIGAENALLQHELSQITLTSAMAETDRMIQESRARESQREAATRKGKLGAGAL